MRFTRIAWAVVFIIGFLYFFLPLLGTFEFSLGHPLGPGRRATEPRVLRQRPPSEGFWESLGYSFLIGIVTIIVSIALLMPTAFWVRLRVPRARPFVEFITLLPFVIPPIVLVFGLLQTFSGGPVPLAASDMGSNVLLTAAYVVLSFPYMYRAVDTGLQAIDIRSLTEAAQSLGAGWPRILIAGDPAEPAGGPAQWRVPDARDRHRRVHDRRRSLPGRRSGRISRELGTNQAYEPAAVAIISFALTWLAMILIAFIGRGARTRVAVTGAR